MKFSQPGWLALLVPVAAVAAGYVLAQRRRPAYALRFTNLALLEVVMPRRPRWRRHVTAALVGLALVLMVASLARPVRRVEVGVARGTVVLAIDVSLSMEATDVEPTRLAAARDAALAFVDDAPGGIRLGLVTFAESARVDVLPTDDRAVLRRAVEGLQLRPGTGIGEAVFASLDALAAVEVIPPQPDGVAGDGRTSPGTTVPPDESDDDEPPAARIVVMSDGETTQGRPNEAAAAAAAAAGVPVWTIAFGTMEGAIVYETEIIPVPINSPALAAVARATGGRHFEAATGDELRAVFDDVGTRVATEERQQDLSPPLTGAALALVAAAGVCSLVWFQRLV